MRVFLCRWVSLLVLCAGGAEAQQTIINVPSLEQTPRGTHFALHESQIRDWGGRSFWYTTNFLTYGLTDRVEVAATVYNLGAPASRYAAGSVGYKTAMPVRWRPLARWQPQAGFGQMLHWSLRGRGADVWSYGQGAVTVPRLGTRLMAGVSHGTPQVFGKRSAHFIGSYEQPLGKHVALLGEWWAGRHEFGDFVPGFNVHAGPWVLVGGYKFSNKPGTVTDGIIVEVGRRW